MPTSVLANEGPENERPAGGGDAAGHRLSRRKFVKYGVLAGGGLTVASAAYLAMRREIPAAIIGAGIRGNTLAQHLGWMALGLDPYVSIKHVCDPDMGRAKALCSRFAPRATVSEDYRKIIGDDSIVAVFIAAPDHWHGKMAIDAMRAGKAVYCEKPLALTVQEAAATVAIANETRSVFQVGTQQRSHSNFRDAYRLIRDGRLGPLNRVEITLRPLGFGEACKFTRAPSSVDWDLWLGPAPACDFCGVRKEHWHRYSDYSEGELGNWGSHQLDIVHWVLGIKQGGPVRISGSAAYPPDPDVGDTPQTFTARLEYEEGVSVTIRSASAPERAGILFEGDRGRIFVSRGKLAGKPVEELNKAPLPPFSIPNSPCGRYEKTSTACHLLNFLRCCQSGDQPVSDVISSASVSRTLAITGATIRQNVVTLCKASTGEIETTDERVLARLQRIPREPYTF